MRVRFYRSNPHPLLVALFVAMFKQSCLKSHAVKTECMHSYKIFIIHTSLITILFTLNGAGIAWSVY